MTVKRPDVGADSGDFPSGCYFVEVSNLEAGVTGGEASIIQAQKSLLTMLGSSEKLDRVGSKEDGRNLVAKALHKKRYPRRNLHTRFTVQCSTRN